MGGHIRASWFATSRSAAQRAQAG